MKVGILGGTFDPIHLAHEELGHAACRELGLDFVLVMPTGNSYLKTIHGQVTSAKHRAAMVKLSIENDPLFRFSDLEIEREGYTYTSDTLTLLSHQHPEDQWYFIIGADSLHGMRDWYSPEVICKLADLVVAGRDDQIASEKLAEDAEYMKQRYGARIHMLKSPDMDVSSTRIRKEIREGRLPHPDLEPLVSEYIAKHGLYGKPRSEEQILESLKSRLKPGRYIHTLGVADTARKLAEYYGTVEPKKAYLAGVLHDCGKYEAGALEHGPVGAVIAREEYGITDEEILGAVRWHTTGRPGMNDLEKMIFIADYIEPNRDQAPHLTKLRRMAYQDMDKTILCILEDTLSYLRSSAADIDARSLDTYNYYKNMNGDCKMTGSKDISKKMLKVAYDSLDEKKAADITLIDIAGVSTLADYYVITNGENISHVHALVDNVQEKMHKAGYVCKSIEGLRSASWVLMDYGDVVVNIFSREDRRWFDLERIWRDGKFLTPQEIEG